MNRLVLDCSVTMAWCFEDQADDHSRAALDALAKAEVLVPGIWALEVANALVVAERRKKLTQAESLRFVALLEGLSIATDSRAAVQALSSTLPLARAYNLSAYDAAYLELALREGVPLATRDAGLVRAARSSGVALI